MEAKSRIGGRTYSVPLGEYRADLGASFIHGIGPGADDVSEWDEKYNPVYELIYDNGIETLLAWKEDGDQKENFIWYNQVKWTRDKIEPYEDELLAWLDEG